METRYLKLYTAEFRNTEELAEVERLSRLEIAVDTTNGFSCHRMVGGKFNGGTPYSSFPGNPFPRELTEDHISAALRQYHSGCKYLLTEGTNVENILEGINLTRSTKASVSGSFPAITR